jgi:hypothetical protein
METSAPLLSTDDFDALIAAASQPKAAAVALAQDPGAGAGEAGVTQNLRQALAWSLELAPQVMTHLVSRAVQSMDRAVISLHGTPQAETIDAAANAMEAKRLHWIKQYPALLRIAMCYPTPSKTAPILAKVDLRICAEEVQELEVLVKSQGSQRANALGPMAYVQALVELLARSDASPIHRPVWAQQLFAALSSQLAWVYPQLHAVLRDPASREISALSHEAGFDEHAMLVFGLSQVGGESKAVNETQGVDTQSQMLAEQARRTVVRLRRQLGMPEDATNALAQALNEDRMALMAQDLDQAEHLMAEIRARGLPMPDLDEGSDELASEATVFATAPVPAASTVPAAPVVAQVDIANLIKEYQNTTSPSLQRVAVPLREALDDLTAPVFLLALKDGQVLSNAEHPVRQFLGLITQRSLRYSSEVAEGFPLFMGAVDKRIKAIVSEEEPTSAMFEKAYNKLASLWRQQDEFLAQEQARNELEQRNMEAVKRFAGRLAFELVGRPDAQDAPAPIKQFLMGPWAQVLAKAQLYPDHDQDEQRYLQAVEALLWSVSVRRASSRKAEHAELRHQLTALLTAGLQSVKMPQAQIDGLLGDIGKLMDAVQAADAV